MNGSHLYHAFRNGKEMYEIFFSIKNEKGKPNWMGKQIVACVTLDCKTYYHQRISLLIIFMALMSVVMNDLEAQEVRFPWLEHVPRIQTQWINTQDEAFSIWNNISQFQNFRLYEKEIGEVLVLIKNMEKQKIIDEKKYSSRYPYFFKLSGEYSHAMKSVIAQLQLVLQRLAEKSKSLEAYSWSQYQKDLNVYNQLLSSYRNIGQKMNNEFRHIQSTN